MQKTDGSPQIYYLKKEKNIRSNIFSPLERYLILSAKPA